MRDDVAISVQNVTMSFQLNKEKVDNLKEYVIKLITHKLEYKKFHALNNITFDVKKGEHLAILGFNGAGKSTLLKAIVGVYKPTTGKIEKCGVTTSITDASKNVLRSVVSIIPARKIYSFTAQFSAIQGNISNQNMMKLLSFPSLAIS